MRTESPPSTTSPSPPRDRGPAQPTSPASKLRRLLADRGLAPRWVLGGLGVLLLATCAAWLAANDPLPPRPIYNGWVFSKSDAARIVAALSAKGIEAASDAHGRVNVPTAELAAAQAMIDKLKLGPRSAGSILDDALAPRLWETPGEREERRLRALEQVLVRWISELHDVVEADVMLNRARSSPRTTTGGGRAFPNTQEPSNALKAVVRVQTEGDRPLSPQLVDAIHTFVAKTVPDLSPNSITVLDRFGRHEHEFLAGVNAPLDQTRVRAREEQLAERIAAKLDWIPGVRVSVRLDAAPASQQQATDKAARRPEPGLESERKASNRVVVNAPLSARVKPIKPDDPLPSIAMRKAADTQIAQPGAAAESEAIVGLSPPRARVLVLVPAGAYVRAYRELQPAKEPSSSELAPYVKRVSESIQTTVAYLLPGDELGQIEIQTIPDPSLASARVAPPSVPSPRWSDRLQGWGVPAAFGVALLAVVFGLRAAASGRRRAARAARSARATSLRREGVRPTETDRGGGEIVGPSALERVRELVRLEPEAAAGVLQRWIGHGGHVP